VISHQSQLEALYKLSVRTFMFKKAKVRKHFLVLQKRTSLLWPFSVELRIGVCKVSEQMAFLYCRLGRLTKNRRPADSHPSSGRNWNFEESLRFGTTKHHHSISFFIANNKTALKPTPYSNNTLVEKCSQLHQEPLCALLLSPR
jgi:hypothetical protein